MIHHLKFLVRYNGSRRIGSSVTLSRIESSPPICIGCLFPTRFGVSPLSRFGDSGLISLGGFHSGSWGTTDSGLLSRRLSAPGSHSGLRGTTDSGLFSRRLLAPNLFSARALHSGSLVSTLVILNDEEGTCVNMLYIVSFSTKSKPSISSKPSPFLLEVCETLSQTDFDAIDLTVKAFAVWCLFRVLLLSASLFPTLGAKFPRWATWIDEKRARAFSVPFVPKVYAQEAAAAKIAKFYAYLVFYGVGMVAGAVGFSFWESKVKEEMPFVLVVEGLRLELVDYERRLKCLENYLFKSEDYTDKALLLFVYATVQLYKVFPWESYV